ncbi:MAG: energy transducer TonB [Flavisolibacter sp.]|nr:energy transducer TonB [Flavisolibacter sp.]
MMSSKNNGFTASDIERYHSGKMSPEERHALEKAALDDPFLADALEGYAFTSTPTTDLAKMQSRLDEQLNQKKVVPLFQRYRWLSVAALFIIIAGTGWLVYDISKKSSQPSVAVQNEKASEKSSNYSMPGQQTIDSNVHSNSSADKKINNKKEAATTAKKEAEINKNLPTEKIQESVVINRRNNQSNGYYKNEPNANSVRHLSAPQVQTEDSKGKPEDIKIVEINRSNTASATRKTNDTLTFDAGKETAFNKDAAVKLATMAPAIQENDTLKHFDIVLQPLPKDSQPALQEVVVGYGVQRKSTDKYPKVTIDTLEPAEGYVKFDDYVINNLKMPEELKTKTIAGEVQLSFDVDQNGQPVNITVVKSLCQKCDEEAVRLLKEGPKWKKKKNKKGKITIKF